MYKYDKESLSILLKTNVVPIMIEDIESSFFENCVVINKDSELTGHYEETDYLPPKWYKELININKPFPLLIIDKINELDYKTQIKFNEILKYKKISTFKLPENTRIILICNNIEKYPLNESTMSLVAKV